MRDTTKIMITGATDGIGRQTAQMLAAQASGPLHLILHGRSLAKLDQVSTLLKRAHPKVEVETMCADFSSLEAVRVMGQEYKGKHDHLDVLINNAGVYMNERRMSEDGLEMTMAVNHLAPFLLTHTLLDSLRAAKAGRIINVSSVAHKRAKLDLDHFASAQDFDPYRAYGASKLANILFTRELARRLGPDAPATVNALHPGVVSTKLLQQGFGMEGPDSLSQGAATSVYLATSPEVQGVSGQYFVKSTPQDPAPMALDDLLAKRLYDLSAELVGLPEGYF